jgi:hypothetical protein
MLEKFKKKLYYWCLLKNTLISWNFSGFIKINLLQILYLYWSDLKALNDS